MGPDYKNIPKATAGSGKSIEELQEFLWNNGTAEQFTQVFHVNVTGLWFTTVAFLGLLDAGNKPGNALEGATSQVVTVSSIGGFRRHVLFVMSRLLIKMTFVLEIRRP